MKDVVTFMQWFILVAYLRSFCMQERLQEIPTSSLNTSGNNFYSGAGEPLSALPGSELEHPSQHQNSAFVNGFHAANDNRLSEVWDGIQNPQIPQFHPGHPQLQPELNGKVVIYFTFITLHQ